jgi:hypothetical protein
MEAINDGAAQALSGAVLFLAIIQYKPAASFYVASARLVGQG